MSKYVEKVKVLKNTYPSNKLKIGFEFICSDVNLLVGNQGTGKSTMLSMLQETHSDIEITLSEDTIKNGVSTFYFDTEKDNPRIQDPIAAYTNPAGNSIGYGFRNGVFSRFRSHGEVLEELTVKHINKAKDCVIILDEPESGLSITNQFKLVKAIKKAVKNNCQFFIATHCYPLIESFDVISLEHLKQMSGKEFIKLCK